MPWGFDVNAQMLRELATGLVTTADELRGAADRTGIQVDAGSSTDAVTVAGERLQAAVAGLAETVAAMSRGLAATARTYEEADRNVADVMAGRDDLDPFLEEGGR